MSSCLPLNLVNIRTISLSLESSNKTAAHVSNQLNLLVLSTATANNINEASHHEVSSISISLSLSLSLSLESSGKTAHASSQLNLLVLSKATANNIIEKLLVNFVNLSLSLSLSLFGIF